MTLLSDPHLLALAAEWERAASAYCERWRELWAERWGDGQGQADGR
jgi:hypothetical protein